MPRQLQVLPRARTDMDEIWEFIARDDYDAADRVEIELQQAIRDLAQLPGKGHRREDVTDQTLRFWILYSYVIVYRYDDGSLTVLRVIHGARNLGKWLHKN